MADVMKQVEGEVTRHRYAARLKEAEAIPRPDDLCSA